MNLVALFFTYLLFCHPKFLAIVSIIVGIVLLFVYYPMGMLTFGIILAFFLFYNAFIR